MILKELDPFTSTDPLEIAGHRAEKQMAFYLKREFGDSQDLFVINGLRLEHGDDACQIDHLIVHRWGTVILESKSVTTEVRINERDEWSRMRDGKWMGMASPLNQGLLQQKLLRDVLQEHAPELLGKLLGMQRRYGGLQHDVFAAISDDGIVVRPTPEMHPTVLKADSICPQIRNKVEAYQRATTAAGVVRVFLTNSSGKEAEYIRMKKGEAEATARFLVGQHKPRAGWNGSSKEPGPSASAAPTAAGLPPCSDCLVGMTSGVASYCRSQSKRFSGRLYCRDCQDKHPVGARNGK